MTTVERDLVEADLAARHVSRLNALASHYMIVRPGG
jgi:hypothetical protein